MRTSQGIGAEPGRFSRAIIAGFVATGVMTGVFFVAYYLAATFGDPDGWFLTRWLWGLANNQVVSTSRSLIYEAVGIHLAIGLALAIVYAYVFDPALPGPPWVRGATFALLPWLLSVVVVLPLLGGGFFGSRLEAGPLPSLGNLILHLAYGVSLGWTYALGSVWREDRRLPDAGAQAAEAESSLALGIAAGGIVGAVCGWLLGATLPPLLFPGAVPSTSADIVLAGALFGTAAGAIVGPLTGLGSRPAARRR